MSENSSELPEYKVEYYTDVKGKRRKKIKKLQKKPKELTSEQLEEIKSAFELFDKDGSNSIDANEMRSAMRALGVKMNKQQIKELMDEIDVDGNGSLDFDEFK